MGEYSHAARRLGQVLKPEDEEAQDRKGLKAEYHQCQIATINGDGTADVYAFGDYDNAIPDVPYLATGVTLIVGDEVQFLFQDNAMLILGRLATT